MLQFIYTDAAAATAFEQGKTFPFEYLIWSKNVWLDVRSFCVPVCAKAIDFFSVVFCLFPFKKCRRWERLRDICDQ